MFFCIYVFLIFHFVTRTIFIVIIIHTHQDAFGKTMNSYQWHCDGARAEAGGEKAAECASRTLIFCKDRGYVNLEVAGFSPVEYCKDEVGEICCYGMDVDLMHRSHIAPGLICGTPQKRLVQRKIVVHMRRASMHPAEQRVDWETMISHEQLIREGRWYTV